MEVTACSKSLRGATGGADCATVLHIVNAIDTSWTILCGILVMFMQAGFSMLEAGCVREQSVQSIFLKNMLDACISAIIWWLVGYGFAYGSDVGSGFIGSGNFAFSNMDEGLKVGWFFQWGFVSTSATIVSGAVAERMHLVSYMVFAAVMTGIIYPVVVFWTWGGGWLSDGTTGHFIDFAGAGVVHICGGTAGLLGAVVVGPRLHRFDPQAMRKFAPHSVPFVVIGTLILWFGWYGFNAGSVGRLTGNIDKMTNVVVNSTLAPASGAVTVFIAKRVSRKRYDVCAVANGVLAGLVSSTAAGDVLHDWASLVVGFVGGLCYLSTSDLLRRFQIDDPLDAFAVHGACGAWGAFSVGLLHPTKGIFYGSEDAWRTIEWQMIGIVAISTWTAFAAGATFGVLKLIGVLRLSPQLEEEGGDYMAATPTYTRILFSAEQQWAALSQKWSFLKENETSYSEADRKALMRYLPEPANWSISWAGLKRLEKVATSHFGSEYRNKSVADVVESVVKGLCEKNGAPAALVLNDWEIKEVDGFVIHMWRQPFAELMDSLRSVYGNNAAKPNLFISALTVFQGGDRHSQDALGENIADAPFVRSMQAAKHLTVVRSEVADMYERGWCLIEMIYGRKYGFCPDKVHVSGPNAYADSAISVMDLKCANKHDRAKILRAVLDEGNAEELDLHLTQLRSFLNRFRTDPHNRAELDRKARLPRLASLLNTGGRQGSWQLSKSSSTSPSPSPPPSSQHSFSQGDENSKTGSPPIKIAGPSIQVGPAGPAVIGNLTNL